MSNSGISANNRRPKPAAMPTTPPLDHYLQLILHRKWIVAAVFVAVTVVSAVIVQALPNIYTAQTLILVDPQKVPESYVKSTVTGSVRDRLSTLSQQILSATRLQKIIDSLHLYQAEKKNLVREEIIAKMRKDITTTVVSDFGAGQDLQAFRISYSGTDPHLVAQVTNELASLFIEENLKAREQQSSGTTEFLENQLQEARKTLEDQENKLKDYRLKHIGEMPDQQSADLQILGQLQNQVQLESESLNRAEQQKTYLESMMTQNAPVVDMDGGDDTSGVPVAGKAAGPVIVPKKSQLEQDREKLADMLTRYKDTWPDVIKLKKQIQAEETAAALQGVNQPVAGPKVPVPPPPPAPLTTQAAVAMPPKHFNPVLQGQLEAVDVEIAKHKEELALLSKRVAADQAKLEAIPIREEETMDLSRDYDMTKAHYSQLEAQALSAETATQLEYRSQGEKFVVLDPAIAPEKPSKPDRPLLDVAGAIAGMLMGFAIALSPEFFGMTIIGPKDINSVGSVALLETIPVIITSADQTAQRRRTLLVAASVCLTTIIAGALLFLRMRHQI